MYLNSLAESKLKQIIYDKTPKPDFAQGRHAAPRQFIVALSSAQNDAQSDEEKKKKRAEEERAKEREVKETLRRSLEITEKALGGNHIEVAGIFFFMYVFCIFLFFVVLYFVLFLYFLDFWILIFLD